MQEISFDIAFEQKKTVNSQTIIKKYVTDDLMMDYQWYDYIML